jgi:hypothetical protein
MLGWGDERSTTMSSKSSSAVATMGIDIGKNSFHAIGLDERGAIVLRQKWSRGQLEARLAKHATLPDRDRGARLLALRGRTTPR